jgi:GYF domain 2
MWITWRDGVAICQPRRQGFLEGYMVRMTTVAVGALMAAAAPAGAQTAPLPPALPSQTPAPPPMPQPETQFYFNDNGTPSGPVSLAEIRAKVEAGAIKPDTLVWKTGLPNWVPAKDLPEVAASAGPGWHHRSGQDDHRRGARRHPNGQLQLRHRSL